MHYISIRFEDEARRVKEVVGCFISPIFMTTTAINTGSNNHADWHGKFYHYTCPNIEILWDAEPRRSYC